MLLFQRKQLSWITGVKTEQNASDFSGNVEDLIDCNS